MSLTSAFTPFEPTKAQPAPSFVAHSDFTVNYLWINQDIFAPEHNEDLLCGVPLHYIDKAIAMAKRYPDAQFNVWTDPEFYKDSPTQFFLESYLYDQNSPENLKLCNMRDIRFYDVNPFFNVGTQNSIWARVDLARLILLQHCVEKDPERAHIYTDFDTDDVFRNFDLISQAIQKHGCAIGAVRSQYDNSKVIENSYLALSDPKLASYLAETCCDEVIYSRRTVRGDRDTVYAAYLRAYGDAAKKFGFDVRGETLIPGMSHNIGYIIPKPEYLNPICV